MKRSPRRLAAVCGAGFALAGCARIHELKIAQCPTVTTDTSKDHVSVQYLGVGGVLLSRKSDVSPDGAAYRNVLASRDGHKSPDARIDGLFGPGPGGGDLVGHSQRQ